MSDRFEVLSRTTAYAGDLLQVDREEIRNPAGATVTLEMVRHPGAAAIVPVLSDLASDDPQILLLRQFRYAAEQTIWEIPAGVLEKGEDPADCAARELEEETGATAETITPLTSVYTTPGFTDEKIHIFLATGLTVSDTKHEDDELIEVVPRSLSSILEMIREGDIIDGKTIVALLFFAGFTLNR